ncbi:hypothetical protein [Altericroceibacterium xinjiangense]|uniref:hypothetical protein n=1 Tax=Altericroceibacterium xinjiangense TaxID=762261 RepID=UPI000F7DC42B|nr:hypothetical protein [Altericroceibacterium xinjiangense]
MRKMVVLLGSALLAGCATVSTGPAVIDGSTAAAFEQTLGKARDDLSLKDRLKFEAALTEFRAQMFARADNRQEYQELVRQGLSGLTAPAIVEEFDRNTRKLGTDAADAIFNLKRALGGGGSSE